MQYCLSDMLGVKQRETLFYCILRSVLVESHIIVELSKLKEELNSALALLERDFPISIQARNVTCMRNPQYLFSNPSRLKSHDWKQVIKNVNYII